ncbi:hypothetical protein CEXT_477741 [Caerostris extrusa]|uniref:Uncharacterized protein n=1 Tax=Caerostris extrusa TaxID=172846 RepID=A0AAV4NW66_CAEEX|nr:hypothetical protein CEXT_477741 [Caerostris extrusa]
MTCRKKELEPCTTGGVIGTNQDAKCKGKGRAWRIETQKARPFVLREPHVHHYPFASIPLIGSTVVWDSGSGSANPALDVRSANSSFFASSSAGARSRLPVPTEKSDRKKSDADLSNPPTVCFAHSKATENLAEEGAETVRVCVEPDAGVFLVATGPGFSSPAAVSDWIHVWQRG